MTEETSQSGKKVMEDGRPTLKEDDWWKDKMAESRAAGWTGYGFFKPSPPKRVGRHAWCQEVLGVVVPTSKSKDLRRREEACRTNGEA